MAERSANDLTYGHLGEALYDSVDKKWVFTRNIDIYPKIEPLQSPKICLSNPDPRRIDQDATPVNSSRAQVKWLLKSWPELAAAGPLITRLAKEADAPSLLEQLPVISSLFEVGTTINRTGWAEFRHVKIFIRACGLGQDVLQLIRPQSEKVGWDRKKNQRIQVLEFENAEVGYWFGSKGAIHQIVANSNCEGSGNYVAVRQMSCITILKPEYVELFEMAPQTKKSTIKHGPSRLRARFILTLTAEQSGGLLQVDVSFNPWYTKRFCVVDRLGRWSTWDIDGIKGKTKSYRATASRFGRLYDGLPAESTIPEISSPDSWARILWCGGINILLVCNRRHMAVFDITEDASRRLFSPQLVQEKSSDWILDIIRNPVELDQCFVLTTTQIFWLKIAIGENTFENGTYEAGATIILSCHHYRGENDNSLRLEILNEDEVSTVFMYSSKSSIVDVYRFDFSETESRLPMYSNYAFMLEKPKRLLPSKIDNDMIALRVLGAKFATTLATYSTGLGAHYHDRDFRFYEFYYINSDLDLFRTICATAIPMKNSSKSVILDLPRLPKHIAKSTHLVRSERRIIDDFIVPESCSLFEESGYLPAVSMPDSTEMRRPRQLRDKAKSADARRVFLAAFHKDRYNGGKSTSLSQSEAVQSIVEVVQNLDQVVKSKLQHNHRELATFLEINDFNLPFGDIEEADKVLKDMVDTLRIKDTQHQQVELAVNNIGAVTTISQKKVVDISEPPGLLRTYDELINLYVAHLPHKTPGPVRLAKERLARSVAIELCLSSMTVSLHSINTATIRAPSASSTPRLDLSRLPVRSKRGESSQDYSQQLPPPPVPAPPPSQASRATSLKSPSTATDPLSRSPSPPPVFPPTQPEESTAISRLRSYSPSIRSQPPIGEVRAAILSHWPSVPGSDPAAYVWNRGRARPARDLGAAGWSGGSAGGSSNSQTWSQPEAAAAAAGVGRVAGPMVLPSSSQPLPAMMLARGSRRAGLQQQQQMQWWGSQVLTSDPPQQRAAATAAESSQVLAEGDGGDDGGPLVMTQPLAGAFGSRMGGQQKSNKRKKGRVAGFR